MRLMVYIFLYSKILLCSNLIGNDKKQLLVLGIENTQSAPWQILKKYTSIGLITNHTGHDSQGNRTIDLLVQRSLPIKKIFVPEHGLHGNIQAAHDVKNSIDAKTKLPVISLYEKGSGKKIDKHILHGINLLIFDIQDSGMRHYTYISTLLAVMHAASLYKIPLFVLDRPNPLGSLSEGPINKNTQSFIACASIPLRHGMTVGEIARYFNEHILEKKVTLHVIPMLNYDPKLCTAHIPYTPLSPNLPTKNACWSYSFLGLLGEVKPFDIGIGTNKAMQCIALPESVKFSINQWQLLQELLKKMNINTTIINYFSTRKKQRCNGLEFKLNCPNSISSFNIMLTILKFFHDQKVKLKFSEYFEVAVGSVHVQAYVQGKMSKQKLFEQINGDLKEFRVKAQGCFLYKSCGAPKLI